MRTGGESIDKIVIHVTEGAFWGSVRWLQSPRAHASSHYIVARNGRIMQLVHLSDIAWHAGNWTTNQQSVGIEHEGYTYGPVGFTDAQYHSSARLAAWIARRSLMPIDRKHVIGHAKVPDRAGGCGGSRGPHGSRPALELERLPPPRPPLCRRDPAERDAAPAGRPLRGIVSSAPRRPLTSGASSSSSTAASSTSTAGARSRYALNTAKLANRGDKLQVHGIAGPGRYDVAGADGPWSTTRRSR